MREITYLTQQMLLDMKTSQSKEDPSLSWVFIIWQPQISSGHESSLLKTASFFGLIVSFGEQNKMEAFALSCGITAKQGQTSEKLKI